MGIFDQLKEKGLYSNGIKFGSIGNPKEWFNPPEICPVWMENYESTKLRKESCLPLNQWEIIMKQNSKNETALDEIITTNIHSNTINKMGTNNKNERNKTNSHAQVQPSLNPFSWECLLKVKDNPGVVLCQVDQFY